MSRPVVCILQARTGSTRLPRKVLLDVLGKPMLQRQIERLRLCAALDRIVLATTDLDEDRPLLALAGQLGIPAFAGSPDDVLDRYTRAARAQGAATVVRVTGDCPLIDPSVVGATVALYLRGDLDYASTGSVYPDGLDTEVFSAAALETAWREAGLSSEREHVTPFIWKNPARFRTATLPADRDLSAKRWTVDEPRDLEFVRAVFARLGGAPFGMPEILALLEREPALEALNAGITRNAGYRKSLAEDQPIGGPP